MTDREAAALRAYLQKGGFVIVDDFKPRRAGLAAASAAISVAAMAPAGRCSSRR